MEVAGATQKANRDTSLTVSRSALGADGLNIVGPAGAEEWMLALPRPAECRQHGPTRC